VNDSNTSAKYKNSFDCFKKTIQVEGFSSLFKGFVPNFARLGPHFVFVNFFLIFLSFPLMEFFRKLFGVDSI
jgi:hypothetical protein